MVSSSSGSDGVEGSITLRPWPGACPRRSAGARAGPRWETGGGPRAAARAPAPCVPGQAHAREDLPSLGQVPVANRACGHARVRSPRAAPQHPVILAEEHLRVLAIGICDEAGIAAEARGGPLPHLPDGRRSLAASLLPGRRHLPLGLGGQPRTAAAGEGVGLEPGDVTDGGLQVAVGDGAMMGDVVLLLPGPAPRWPPLAPSS